jgi:hypothetical protein
MNKFAAFALTGAVGVAVMGYTMPAEARAYVGVGIGVHGVAWGAPAGYAHWTAMGVYGPHYRGRRYVYRPGFARYGFHAYARRWR